MKLIPHEQRRPLSVRSRHPVRPLGTTFHRLTVISEPFFHRKKVWYDCQCQCGVCVSVTHDQLRNPTGKGTKSCGCRQRETSASNRITPAHGQSNSTIYQVYRGIIQRCYNQNAKAYKNYGGRGIAVCDEWKGQPLAFITWAIESGYTKGLTIDRKDNDGPYSPGNCRWVTRAENNRKRRNIHWVTFAGETLPLQTMAIKHGYCSRTIYGRLKRGWSVEKALTTP